MLRSYGRLGFLAATITFFLVVLSLNLLQTSPSRFGDAGEAHLQGEEVLGAKLSEAFGAGHGGGEHAEPVRPAGEEEKVMPVAGEQAEPERPEGKEAAIAEHPVEAADPRPPQELPPGNGEPALPASPEEAAPASPPEEPDHTPLTKVIVMGKLSSEDTGWVGDEMHEWQNAIYHVDLPATLASPTGLKTKFNKAKEVTPYLTYIVDHYPNFPDIMAFIHAHRRGLPQAWHNDAPGYDAVNMLNALRLETVLDRGYVNLRCNNEIGCPAEIEPFRDPPAEDKHAEHAYPYIYAHFFNASWAEMREQIPVVATQCCAQFAVSREQVLQREKGEYERYLRFVEETHYDDDTAGRVLEYMWHIIFGREAVHCENIFECWCNVYGRCRHTGGGGLSRGGGMWGV